MLLLSARAERMLSTGLGPRHHEYGGEGGHAEFGLWKTTFAPKMRIELPAAAGLRCKKQASMPH